MPTNNNGFANTIESPISDLPTTKKNGRRPIVLIDTREKTPYEFDESKFNTRRTRLATGDYSVAGHQSTISIERKTGNDFLNSITHQHQRFFKELNRLSTIPYSLIVVEAHLRDYITGEFSDRVTQSAFYGNLFHIMTTYGIKTVFAGDRAHAINFVEHWIRWVLRNNNSALR